MHKIHPDWSHGYWDMVLAAQADLVIGHIHSPDWNLKDIDALDCICEGMDAVVQGNLIAFEQA